MIFYLDFEATQPENEIIAIGAVAENGSTFHSLVKPQFSSISQFVSDLTHISQEDLEKAPVIDVALKEFDRWVMNQELNIMNCRFVTYGDDKKFLQATLPAIKTSTTLHPPYHSKHQSSRQLRTSSQSRHRNNRKQRLYRISRLRRNRKHQNHQRRQGLRRQGI